MNMISIISCATKADRMQVAAAAASSVGQAASGLARCSPLWVRPTLLPSPSLCDPLLHLHVIIIAIKGHICLSPRWRWLVKHPSCGCHMRQIRRNVFHILTCQQQTSSPQSCAPSPKQHHQHESPTPPASTTTTTTIKESHKNCYWARCLTDGLSDEDCEAASRAHLISGICSCPARDDEGQLVPAIWGSFRSCF